MKGGQLHGKELYLSEKIRAQSYEQRTEDLSQFSDQLIFFNKFRELKEGLQQCCTITEIGTVEG